MAIERNITDADDWFAGEDKTLKVKFFEDDDVTLRDATGMNFIFTLADDPEGTVLFTKSSPTNITVTGVFDEDPGLNTQFINVSISADDTKDISKQKLYYSVRRSDPGFRGLVTHGIWPVRKAAQPAVI